MENVVDRVAVEKMVMNLAIYANAEGIRVDNANLSRKRKKRFHPSEVVADYYKMMNIGRTGNTLGNGKLDINGVKKGDCSMMVINTIYYVNNHKNTLAEAIVLGMAPWVETQDKLEFWKSTEKIRQV